MELESGSSVDIVNYRRFGRTELAVSEVGFGSHHFDQHGRRIGRLTEESFTEKERVEHVAAALDGGINFLHCAHTIGEQRNAEIALFGKALKELGRREECYLAAQFIATPDLPAAEAPVRVQEQIDDHLRDLYTDRIEVFELNIAEELANKEDDGRVEGVLEVMERVKAAGKARSIGGVSHHREYLLHLMERYDPFDAIGTPYNVLKPEAGERLFPLARKMDVGTVAIQPFGKGQVLQLAASDERLAAVGKEDEGVARTALRWVLSDSNLSVAIPGMKCVEEILENIGVSGTMHPGGDLPVT